MIKKIDVESEEFKTELAKTIKFTDKVNNQFGWVYNPQEEVNEGVQMGLARNKMMYKKRFCPCFMIEEVNGKPKSVEDRICPCKPAIEKEIPTDGVCHCGIFCTPEYAEIKKTELETEEAIHTGTKILTYEECEALFNRKEVDSEELVSLIQAKEKGIFDFKLVDVREDMEWKRGHIKAADFLVPTSTFFNTWEQHNILKEDKVIVYCHVGSRSAHIAKILHDNGYMNIGNLTHGFLSFQGETEK